MNSVATTITVLSICLFLIKKPKDYHVNIVKITNQIEMEQQKQTIETDVAEGPPEGTNHPLAEAAPSWFDCKHQEMPLALANINNFIKYGRSKGARLLKFHVFHCSFGAAEFAQQITINVRQKL